MNSNKFLFEKVEELIKKIDAFLSEQNVDLSV